MNLKKIMRTQIAPQLVNLPNCAATSKFTQRKRPEPSRCSLANAAVDEYDCADGAGQAIGSPPLPTPAQILWQET